MAGSYNDAPSRRIAYDDDLTVVLVRILSASVWGSLSGLSEADQAELNDEDNSAVGGTYTVTANNTVQVLWVYPELREFDGAFFAAQTNVGNSDVTEVETSGDTTNGVDGTWTQRTANFGNYYDVYADYRDNIVSYAVSNVRGVRVQYYAGGSAGGKYFKAAHLYGEIASGETPDRLLFIDNDDDLEFSKPQDYGDTPRGSAVDHVIYLTNNSSSLAANSVQLTGEDLYLGSGSWYTLSEGSGFSSTLALASSISNGANSPDITIRRIIPDSETLGLHAARIYASVGSWT